HVLRAARGLTAGEVGGRWVVEPSRGDAIRLALEAAEPGDVVVVAGKGHEATQEFADRTVAFDDRLVAEAILRELSGEPGQPREGAGS
ncbi:MAG TPA: hypothetical protein VNU01_01305, partial [Egibacteraceae bacterium]|nr:hypothetical protein [Egibacteraceae bacterium]